MSLRYIAVTCRTFVTTYCETKAAKVRFLILEMTAHKNNEATLELFVFSWNIHWNELSQIAALNFSK